MAAMEPAEAVVLGAIQGVVEWLPISSEAAVSLVMTQVFGTEPASSVEAAVMLHSGTMLAALVYFRSEFAEMARDPDLDGGLSRFVVVATAATVLVGAPIYLLLMERIPSDPSVFASVVGGALLATGVLRLIGSGGSRKVEELEDLDSGFMGFLQGFSIIPGISRSGSTVFALLYRDFSAEYSFRLSFIASVPAVAAAQIGVGLLSASSFTPELALASATAFLVGLASIGAVLKLAERMNVAMVCFGLAALSFLSAAI